jgi:hypothetical protein
MTTSQFKVICPLLLNSPSRPYFGIAVAATGSSCVLRTLSRAQQRWWRLVRRR